MYKIVILLLVTSSLSYAGDLSIRYSDVENTVDSYTVSIKVSDKSGPLDFNASYGYGETDSIVSTDEGEIGIGYDPIVNDTWSLWFDERAGYDKMAGIKFENFIGFGPKYYIITSGKKKFSLSTGILYHYKEGQEEGVGRYSHRVKYGNGRISGVYFYQPNMEDSSDYITEGKLEVKLTDVLSVFYKEEYRSVEDIKKTEKSIMFNLHFKFKEVN